MNKVEDLSLHAMLDAYSDHIRLGAVASPAWSAALTKAVGGGGGADSSLLQLAGFGRGDG